MPGRSPHFVPPPPPMISRRSPPHSRGRMRSPEARPRRPSDFRTGSVRRSRSPIGKRRSLSPPLKRNLSPKRIRDNARRPPPGRKHSRSKSPVGPTRTGYKAGPSAPTSSDRFNAGSSYDRERVQFRGPEGSINFDVTELKKIAVEIRRPRLPVSSEMPPSHINRSITNPEDITLVRRHGVRGHEMSPGFLDRGISKPEWGQDGDFRRHKDFKNEGSRPLSIRPEFVPEISRDRQSDEYRRIVALNSAQNADRERSEREKDRSRDGRYSPPPRFEEPPHSYLSREPRERVRSPGFSSSRRSPPRGEFYEGHEKIHDERRDSSRDDLRHELDLRRRDDGRYPERHGSYERESDLRTRIMEKRIDPHNRHEDFHYERSRRRELSIPPHERRRGSVDSPRPSQRDMWEREHEREVGSERRKRPLSREREREDGRIRGNGRERFDDFNDERSRRFPFKPEPRSHFKDDDEFIPSTSIRGRGGPPIRRGFSGGPSYRGRSIMRGSPRGFRGGPSFVRGGPPRGHFAGSRGGFPPRK